MPETPRDSNFEKEITKKELPQELQGIDLSPENFAKKEGESFKKVVLGHLDMDTLASYCLARDNGFINEKTEINVKQRIKKDDLTSPEVLTIEVQGEKIPNIQELQDLKKQLQNFGLDTTDIENRIQTQKQEKLTPEQYNAKLGNITHTGEQKFTATAKLFALTGKKPEHQDLALLIQQSEETRTFKRKKTREGRSYNQIVDQIIKKYLPESGNISPADLPFLLDEVYDLFTYVKENNLEFTDNIPLETPASNTDPAKSAFQERKEKFARYLDAMKRETEKRKEELKDLKLLDTKETPTGLRVTLFDGQKIEVQGVFGKINQLTDDEGKRLSDVTVLVGRSPKKDRHQVKIALHKSLEGRIDLAPLAMVLNLREVLKGDITLEEGSEEFGGHTSKFIGTPKKEGTTIKPEEIFDLVTEYFFEERHTEKELLDFAAANNLKGARVIFVPGTGEKGIPERALQFVDVESSSLSPELYGAGMYGEKLKTVRETQIDFKDNKFLSAKELVEKYFENNQFDKALKVAVSLPKEEAFRILANPSFQDEIFKELVLNQAFAAKIYCPEQEFYFDLPKNSYPEWVKNDKDRAAYRFIEESSASFFVDTFVLAANQVNLENFTASLKNILNHEPIRKSFSKGQIYGHLLETATAYAMGVNPHFFRREETNPRFNKILQSQNSAEEMTAFIANQLSSAEAGYILGLLEEREALLKGQELEEFRSLKKNLVEKIQSRTDFKEIKKIKPYPEVSIETQETSEKRKVLTIEIGRQSHLKEQIEEKLKNDPKENKKQVDVALIRNGFVLNPSEQTYIEDQIVESVLNLHGQDPENEFEIYVQAPLDFIANISYQLGKREIKVRFGKFKQGKFVLSNSPEMIET